MNAQKKAAHWAQDLLDEIRFDVENGKIWFHGERMLLSHAYALWQFREDLIESLGMARAKRFLLRYGYYAGMQDAQIAKKIRPHQSIEEAFAAGPQLHTIRGMVKVTPRLLSFDVEKGLFKGTFDWHDSFEVSYHKKKHGISKEPICWTLLGYASGYTSYFLGKEIAFKETLCEAMGHDHCHIIGKTVDEWEGETDLERSFLPDSIEEELFSLRNEINELKQQNHYDLLDSTQLFDAVGESAAFRQVCDLLEKASQSKVSVLLEGETGVGKEAFAKGLHAGSRRADQPFVAVNCACIPPELVESELFGVEKGAFTGAVQSKPGKFERAHSGTIFLDEIGEMAFELQAKLLRILETGEYIKIGDTKPTRVNVRIIAATNRNLSQEIVAGRFREDLFYRLSVFQIHLPPLRERAGDIRLLAKAFIKSFAEQLARPVVEIAPAFLEALDSQPWKGNIRELRNVIERSMIVCESGYLDIADLPFDIQNAHYEHSNDSSPGSFELSAMERRHIARVLEYTKGNKTEAARLLKIGLTTLYRKIEEYKISDL